MGDVSANPPAEAQRAGRPFLLYTDGDDRQQVFSFEPGSAQLSVGRQPSSDLVLDWDGQVSRLHARFERVGDGWEVVDDGLSRNGTFVNGERLSGRRPLRDGDTVRFGGTTMTFRSPQGEDQSGPAAGGGTPPAMDISTTQRRVLVALSRPYKESEFASPATDEQIAAELFLSANAVKTHLGVLYAKLDVEEMAPDQKRARLVERAFSAGLISERDL
jgi:pSer/pThr/pTyr-binding forkhead associated (FHA) protein